MYIDLSLLHTPVKIPKHHTNKSWAVLIKYYVIGIYSFSPPLFVTGNNEGKDVSK
jgi:hypothetical protein